MPSGYTQAIADGATLEQFALGCARAFGACISMKDEPLSSEIPEEFEPSSYYVDNLKKAKKEHAELMAMSDEECSAMAKKEYGQHSIHLMAMINEKSCLKLKYEKMLKKVNAWRPPTEDHAVLKRFMKSQITESIDADCSIDYLEEELSGLRELSGKEWRAKKKKLLLGTIDYYTKGAVNEKKTLSKSSLWVKQLRRSLKSKKGDK